VPRAKRRLGQHFLADPRILARIADTLDAGPHDTVLEIGPGRGGLTAELIKSSGQVVAIEKDRDLVGPLKERFPSIEIVAADALEIDWHALVGGPYLLAGNIPYNITSPLLDKALTPPLPVRIVFLVQKEVADRVTAAPGTSAYGALTVGIQAVASAERVFTIPAGAFQPRPKIDSAVLRLEPLKQPLVGPAEREGFRALVVGLFGFRRKQLLRGIRELTEWSPAGVTELLRDVGIGETVRPEVLSPSDFVRLYRGLVDGGWNTGVTL
jgi:16S rRNA (adenine1518-N6/adenine1519-N6)-dimethyltransferase